MSYSNPTTGTYRFTAGALSGGVAVIGRIIGPAGKTGRLNSISTVVTTNVTVAAASVLVGINGDTDAHGTASVAISSANAAVNSFTDGATNLVAADTVVEIGTDGAATAGAADITVIIDWE